MARGLAAYGILEDRSRTSGSSQGYDVYNPNGKYVQLPFQMYDWWLI